MSDGIFTPVGLDDGLFDDPRGEANAKRQRVLQRLCDRNGTAAYVKHEDASIQYTTSLPGNMPTASTNDNVPMTCNSNANVKRIHGDMTMRVSAHGVRTLVREFVKEHLFRLVKFFNKDLHGDYELSRASVCGLVVHHCNIALEDADAAWWATMRKNIVKTLTNHRNNVIKTVRSRFRGTL
jgi:hypothetical protein